MTAKVEQEKNPKPNAVLAEKSPVPIIEGAGIRAQIAPHAAMASLVLAAAATRAAMTATGAQAEVALTVAGAAFVIAVVGAWVARRRLDDRKARSRAIAFLGTAATWLATATVTGVTVNMAAILAVVGSALSLHWWNAKRIPNTPAKTFKEIKRDTIISDWRTYIGAPGGALPESRLEGREDIGSGQRYVLRLPRGRATYNTATAALPQIRSGLNLRLDEDLIIERHPVLPESFLQLTLVTKSPIKESVEWPGPYTYDPMTGCVALGPHADGEGVASWRLLTDDSLWGGYITGSSGSGKSRLIDGLALACAAAGCIVWFADGDEGASSALLSNHADWTALDDRLDEAGAMLDAALLVMKVRRAENRKNKWDGFRLNQGRAPLLIFIDECHVIFKSKILQAKAAEIVRRGRKVGVNIVAASQVGTLDAFGGSGNNADVLRGQLRAGNAVLLRSMSNNTKTVFGVDIDPTKFPDIPGYGYYLSGKGSAARTAPFRSYFVTDTARDHWAEEISWTELSSTEATLLGKQYLRRVELADLARDGAAQWLADLSVGKVNELAITIPRPAPEFEVAQFPVWDPSAFTATKKMDEPALLPVRDIKVLAAIKNGVSSPRTIASVTGYSESHVYSALSALQGAGHIARNGYGKYQAA